MLNKTGSNGVALHEMRTNSSMNQEPQLELPDARSLARGLKTVLEPRSDGCLELLDRKLHRRMSTFPLEVVRCRLQDGRVKEVVCKYSGDKDVGNHEYRGGVCYEADVYRDVLQSCGMPVPAFLGTYRDAKTGWTWLVLDYLSGAEKSGETENGLVRAVEWLGNFHALHEGTNIAHSTLRVYDIEYFVEWAARTIEYTRPYVDELPWLRPMCEAYFERVANLLQGPLTIIHGEYYYKNVLVADDVAYPVDWETAAVGPGVIDIAAITECWREATVSECIARYCASRWPDGAPPDFQSSLEIARAYWLFRWLGDAKNKTRKRLPKRLPLLRKIALRWGLIDEHAP
jgi:hypothetical protein